MSLCQFSPARCTPTARPPSVMLEMTTICGLPGTPPALTRYIQFNLTEAAGECDLLWWSETLVAEEDDAVGVIGLFNLGKGRVVQGWARLTPRTSAPMAAPVGITSMDIYYPPSPARYLGVRRGDLSPPESVHPTVVTCRRSRLVWPSTPCGRKYTRSSGDAPHSLGTSPCSAPQIAKTCTGCRTKRLSAAP
jgi:hypothetical protein